MNVTGFIDEIDLEMEFGGGQRHVDIRYGILNHGVLDCNEREGHQAISLGVVGTAQTIEGFLGWLKECSDGVDAKESKKPNLFPRFPGFGPDSPFNAQLNCDDRAKRILGVQDISKLGEFSTPGEVVKGAVALYLNEIDYLVNETKPDVICCLVPDVLSQELERAADMGPKRIFLDDDVDNTDQFRHDFHHCLKAESMAYRTPIQIVLPSTFGMGRKGKATKRKRGRKAKPRQLQDPATRAWNIFTALYYKAGGVPWRMPRDASDYMTCFVGVSFYKSLDEKTVMTSIAQVFNERGEGIVVRGGPARISKEDRTPHLNETDAGAILKSALERYRDEHKTLPARVVLHKTSYFTEEEMAGFRSALTAANISMADMISIRKSSMRLFRHGQYPVIRGTHLPLGDTRHLLYTRGSVPFFETYPGLYAPRALELRLDSIERSPEDLCREILALTKMNWNNTQFDTRDPITIRAARRVGDIMKYIPQDTPKDQIAKRYSFYM